ncbi:MAG: protein kinase, partial [archaeon]|nr:protein kinase [archaeon]
MGVVCGSTAKDNSKNKVKRNNRKSLTEPKESNTKNNKSVKFDLENETENKSKLSTNTSSKPRPKSSKNVVTLDSNVFISRGALNPDKVYTKERLLGKGSYGIVYLVKHKQLNKYFAMKTIHKRNQSKEEEENLMNEIEILKKLDHPNILKINDFYSLGNDYNIITEYCKEGELFNEIKNYAPFSEPIAAYFMKQILSAVCYCHSKNVIHRDLKPENILIFKREKNGCHQIKIIDFGTAKVFSKDKKENLLIGSSYYIAPEVLSCSYTEKCDLWSCGVIMYILLTGRPPFGGGTDKQILDKIIKGTYDLSKYPWGIISKEAKDLIKKLIEPNQNKRLSAEEALKHPWFKIRKAKALDKKLNSIDSHSAKKLINNLKEYQCDNIMRTAVVAYLVHNNTQLSQAYEAVKLFNKIDTNGDGRIVKEELYNGLHSYMKIDGKELKNE